MSLKRFNQFSMIKEETSNSYVQFDEHNSNEGETWSFFVRKEGNEEFIDKLKLTIIKFSEIEDDGDYLEFVDDNVPEMEVDIMCRRGRSGYMNYYNKVDEALDPKKIKDENVDNFIDSFYKGKLFN